MKRKRPPLLLLPPPLLPPLPIFPASVESSFFPFFSGIFLVMSEEKNTFESGFHTVKVILASSNLWLGVPHFYEDVFFYSYISV